MKKIIFILLNFIIAIYTVNAQKGIDFSRQLMSNGDKIPVSKPNREMVKDVLGR